MDKSPSYVPHRGAIDPAVAAELPGLRLDWLAVDVPPASTSERARVSLRDRLRALSDRYRGATVIAMRTWPIPRAYRTFYRQIGLDPDVERIPSERAATERLLHGGFRSTDLISDACVVAVVETGVPVWALDGAAVDPGAPGLGVGLADASARSPGAPPGSLVVCDRRTVHAPLFGSPLRGHEPGPAAATVVLYALGVAGVPQIHIDEALWTAAELLC
jgi:DNA/RNA-binding domain of Phe-tRNA-synthetase-like protein